MEIEHNYDKLDTSVFMNQYGEFDSDLPMIINLDNDSYAMDVSQDKTSDSDIDAMCVDQYKKLDYDNVVRCLSIDPSGKYKLHDISEVIGSKYLDHNIRLFIDKLMSYNIYIGDIIKENNIIYHLFFKNIKHNGYLGKDKNLYGQYIREKKQTAYGNIYVVKLVTDNGNKTIDNFTDIEITQLTTNHIYKNLK